MSEVELKREDSCIYIIDDRDLIAILSIMMLVDICHYHGKDFALFPSQRQDHVHSRTRFVEEICSAKA